MIKNMLSRLSRLSHRFPYIGGVIVYSVPDKYTTPPILSFFIDLYIRTYTRVHYSIPPLHIDMGGTGGTGGTLLFERLNAGIDELKDNALNKGIFKSIISSIMGVFQ